MDLRVRSTHQTAEPLMDERIVTKTQKGEGVQVQNQSDDDRFFWCPWNCLGRILATKPSYLSARLQKYLATSDALSEDEIMAASP